jgi:DNA-binding NarL/FixJ family response regulator
MTDTGAVCPLFMIGLLSHQRLVWFGLQKILATSTAVKMGVLPYQWRSTDELTTENQPDAVIIDLETERDALRIIAQIRQSSPLIKIVLLCGFEDLERTREVVAAGVDGILLTVQPPTVLLAVLETLYASAQPRPNGEHDGSDRMSLGSSFKNELEAVMQSPAWPDALTEREREIIRLVGKGLSNKDIAYTLSISDSTVRHHMTSIFDKVGVPNRQKLLIHAYRFRATPV